MEFVSLNDGNKMPILGFGVFQVDPKETQRCVEDAISVGYRSIDTAKAYFNEESVGAAIKTALVGGLKREELFITTKLWINDAGEEHALKAFDASMKKLGLDYLDLYLYHWRGSVPLAETVACLEDLKAKGKIRAWGVSNFDTSDMEELFALPSGKNCAVNQVLYHLGSRGIEFDLLPWMRRHGVALMAYCPLAQAGTLRRGLFENKTLAAVAGKHGCDATQVLLSWCIRDGSTIAIPRSSKKEHTLLNAGADALKLDEEDFINLDKAFPPPSHKMPLDVE